MRTLYTAAFAMLTGAAIGALAVQGLRAQTKPPAYVVSEIEITNLDAYQKEYVPLTQASNQGGRRPSARSWTKYNRVRRRAPENSRRHQPVRQYGSSAELAKLSTVQRSP